MKKSTQMSELKIHKITVPSFKLRPLLRPDKKTSAAQTFTLNFLNEVEDGMKQMIKLDDILDQ